MNPLLYGETLLGRPRTHERTLALLALQGLCHGVLELIQQMGGCHGLNREPETRHLTQTTDTRTNTKRTFPAELDRDKTERLVTGGNKRELSTAKDIGRELGEFGL